MRPTLLAALAAVAIVGVAEAQKGGPAPAPSRFPPKETAAEVAPPDWRAEPRYATLNLQVGFEPDPREVAVDAGGSRDAGSFNTECAGWIDFSRPDVDLNYSPGQGQFPLYISAVSQADTTIVINDPQGNWHCNDDLDGLNPGVVFQQPLHGNYNIWVGTLDRGPTRPATVRISEVPPRR
ncbi:hypothetical protein [Falsiroseomonas sp. HW251]|uniref:hypothetical protein n=1 Tax=Falsiroseomonas sp. HW251 TaxID=3390998 RepID=UPI003D31516A